MRKLILIGAIVAVAGCTLNPSGKTATPSPSPLPTGVANLSATGEALAPGRYSFRDFGEPIVTFEVGGVWQAVQLYDGFFDIQQDLGTPDVIAVQFARPDGIHGGDGSKVPTDAADAVALLSDNPGLVVVETSSSRIGGLDGSQVTVENDIDDVAPFMNLPPGEIGINVGRRLRIAFFDTDDGLLAIMVGGSVEKWEEALAAAEPILQSIEISQ
jgi:hypothetical protein